MEQKKIEVTCPILTSDSAINVAQLSQLKDVLPCRDSRIYGIGSDFNAHGLKDRLLGAILKFDILHLRTLYTGDGEHYEMWFYSRTKVKASDIVVRLSIYYRERYVELFAATKDGRSLTGLLADMGRGIQKAIENEIRAKEKVYQVFNLSIKDSVIQRSNFLSSCDLQGICEGDIVIGDSIIQRSNTPEIR